MDKYLKIYRFPKNHQFTNQTFIEEFKDEGPGPIEEIFPEEPMGGMEGEGPEMMES